MKPLLATVPAVALFSGLWFSALNARSDDWPMLGRDRTRNAVSPEKNPPIDWQIEERDGAAIKRARNIQWQAALGGHTVGDPVVANGLVWIGTNNEEPRDPKIKGDASVLMCFRERDGQFLYQYVSPRWPEDKGENDNPRAAICCSPLIEGHRLWFTTNRCETVCLDIGPLRRGEGDPRPVWKLDMTKDLGVMPRSPKECADSVRACSVAAYKDFLYVITGNGADWEGKVPAPQAPSLVCLHQHTGKVVWQDSSPGKNILHGQWASPLVVEVNGRAQVIASQGDGWLRSFDALTGKPLWKFDTNPKDARWQPGGQGTRNYLLATPVCYENRIYIANGRHPQNGRTAGWLYCLHPTGEGDISLELDAGPGKGKPNPNSGVVWYYGGRGPKNKNLLTGTWCNVAVMHGLVIAPDGDGYVHCLDARTGQKYWTHDLRAATGSCPLIVDGKVYVAGDDGIVSILCLTEKAKVLAERDMLAGVHSSPVFANGVLFIATDRTLYAIKENR